MSTALPSKLNRLQFSKSPYLLQHATNPVDWYEWGDEAFERARVEKKPVFLSVGYAACHWCHVLAHESFENEQIAQYLNENFVNVKVDREERPDVDRVYMTFIQATVGRGGWPMSVFLTPSLHPFFGGTYFPPTQFLKLLNRITELWATDSAEMQASGENIMSQLREITVARTTPVRDADQDVALLSEKLVSSLAASFDSDRGGFGGAPKFPSPAQTLTPLLRHAYFSEDPSSKAEALDMSTTTLLSIDAGGIHDHVGGGFARYSVDSEWHVPHFEKMLYDQAQLLTSALTAALLHPVDSSARTSLQTMSEDIISYLSSSLTSRTIPAFFSAEDADSLPDVASTVKVEGAYYVWEWRELEAILEPDELKLFARHYGAELSGNVDARHDVQGELIGKNVLARQFSVEQSAEHAGISVAQAQSVLAACRAKLIKHRDAHRPKPHLDDKVVTSWNGLVISALSLAHTSLPASIGLKEKTLMMATDAARFLRENLWNPESQELRRSWREGPGPRGMSDDYAFLIQGLLDLYEATGATEHLLFADQLQTRQNDLFHDPIHGGYFCSPADDPHLLVRLKDVQDGAEPSASGITLSNLLRLAAVFDDVREDYLRKADGIVDGTGELLASGGQAVGTTIASMWLLDKGLKQLVMTGAASDPATQALRGTLDSRFIPNRLLLYIDPKFPPTELASRNEVVSAIIDGLAKEGGYASVRVCEAGLCGLPILSDVELIKELE